MEIATTTAAAGRDEFLNLLVTQLRHQDPLEPVKQEDFLAQLAQFSTLEGIEQLNGNLAGYLESQSAQMHVQNLSGASSMIGETVTYTAADDTEADTDSGESQSPAKSKTGVVEAVVVDGQSISLRINGDDIPLSDIEQVGIPIQSEATATG